MEEKTKRLVMAALMMCLTIIATMFFRLPIPFANGYVNLGDAFVFLSVLVLGAKHGALAGATGAAVGDVLGGFAIWAPWTFVIKAIMALLMGFFTSQSAKKPMNRKYLGALKAQFIGMFVAGLWMTAGYYAAEGIVYGNWAAALLGIPWNIGQFATGMAIAAAVTSALCKTPAKRYFAYHL